MRFLLAVALSPMFIFNSLSLWHLLHNLTRSVFAPNTGVLMIVLFLKAVPQSVEGPGGLNQIKSCGSNSEWVVPASESERDKNSQSMNKALTTTDGVTICGFFHDRSLFGPKSNADIRYRTPFSETGFDQFFFVDKVKVEMLERLPQKKDKRQKMDYLKISPTGHDRNNRHVLKRWARNYGDDDSRFR